MVAFYLDNASLESPSPPSSHPFTPPSAHSGLSLSYDDIIDSIVILLEDPPPDHVVEPINLYASILLDDDDAVIGAMVDAFLTQAVYEFPDLQSIANYMRLGSRPRGDTALFRTDRPERSVQPDDAWHDDAIRAVRDVFIITGDIE